MPTAIDDQAVTIGGVVERYGVTRRQAQVVIDRIGAARRIGKFRIVPTAELPRVETGLRAAGYLKSRAAEPIEAGA